MPLQKNSQTMTWVLYEFSTGNIFCRGVSRFVHFFPVFHNFTSFTRVNINVFNLRRYMYLLMSLCAQKLPTYLYYSFLLLWTILYVLHVNNLIMFRMYKFQILAKQFNFWSKLNEKLKILPTRVKSFLSLVNFVCF